MTRLIHCVKLKKQAEGLATPPFPGGVEMAAIVSPG